MVLKIEAYDWNSPQRITPGYTAEKIEQALAPQLSLIKKPDEEIKVLKERIKEAGI
jgi:hypothetical protein